MEIIKNVSTVWNEIWKANPKEDFESIKKRLVVTKNSEAWQNYTEVIVNNFGGWHNVRSIELGSGIGWYSFVAASEGAQVTLLDYSEDALKLAKDRFSFFSFNADFIFGDAFKLIKAKKYEFNVSWSFGTAEHFKYELRQIFFELHFDYLEKNGITIISCPYKYAINYRLWMYYAKKYKQWNFGLEIPYSKKEYLKRLKLTGNILIEISFQEGRPCLNKLLFVLKKNSKLRFYIFLPFIRVIQKFKIKIAPFNFRSIILIAKNNNI